MLFASNPRIAYKRGPSVLLWSKKVRTYFSKTKQNSVKKKYVTMFVISKQVSLPKITCSSILQKTTYSTPLLCRKPWLFLIKLNLDVGKEFLHQVWCHLIKQQVWAILHQKIIMTWSDILGNKFNQISWGWVCAQVAVLCQFFVLEDTSWKP